MYNEYDVNNYHLIDSIIHKLNPIIKIILSLLAIMLIMIARSSVDIALITLYIITIVSWSDINIKIYLKNIFIFKYFFLLLAIILILLPISIFSALLTIYKIILSIIILVILSLTTPQTEITYGIERTFRFLNKKISVNKLALNITLFLRFIPMLTEEYEKVKKIKTIRKDKNKHLTLFQAYNLARFKQKKIIRNMNIRLYNYNISRTNYQMNDITKKDIVFIIFNFLMLLVIILY